MTTSTRVAQRPDGGPPLLEVRDLDVEFGARSALSGANLTVRSGDIVALAGENGAGKSTLVRCIAGDLSPSAGEVRLDGERVRGGARAITRRGVSVVWQDLALCDNLDIASNLLLGRERRLLSSDARFHAAASEMLASIGIPLSDTTHNVGSLSGGQRQLVAVARAMRDRPRLLILDEPTASLGVSEAGQVEDLIRRLSDQGTTILLVSHDIDQMFRLADRISILRHGRSVADVSTGTGHPDQVVALMSGQRVDSSARRQLDRLHSLVGRLNSSDPSSSLAVILSALGTALAAERLCIHLLDGGQLRLMASVGLSPELSTAWSDLRCGPAGGPAGIAADTASTVVEADARTGSAWSAFRRLAERSGVRSSWSVPVTGSGGLVGVITVLRRGRGTPHRDELDLVTLYAGYAASAAERDRLLGEVTARNSVLETIREVLEGLSGAGPLPERLDDAIDALRLGLGAEEVALLGEPDDHAEGLPRCRGWSGDPARQIRPDSPLFAAYHSMRDDIVDGGTCSFVQAGSRVLAVPVASADGPLVLLACLPPAPMEGTDAESVALLDDAARSLQLALERDTTERAHREAAGLRKSRELQRKFLSRLSHELRTPLTAIQGYADSLLQPDVTWDDESTNRFLSRIATESARLGRLVADLLDTSAIEADALRLHHDWCDLELIVDAARSCLGVDGMARVSSDCAGLPTVWADHDRLEQVLVNLMDNAIRHNPPGTSVHVHSRVTEVSTVVITVTDDGVGLPPDMESVIPRPKDRRSATAGAGLGLSIAWAIVEAHEGRLTLERLDRGTRWRIELPVDAQSSRSTVQRGAENAAVSAGR